MITNIVGGSKMTYVAATSFEYHSHLLLWVFPNGGIILKLTEHISEHRIQNIDPLVENMFAQNLTTNIIFM